MKKIERVPILITGAARSGTSLIAGALYKAGAFGGLMSGPNKNNKKGMFENKQIREKVLKPYLRSIAVDPKGQHPLPEYNDLYVPADLRSKVENIMISEGYESGSWFYKGAKLSLVWPVWDVAFPNAKWIIVRRSTTDIIRSCRKTGFMSAFASKKTQEEVGVSSEWDGWLWWIHQHEQRFVDMMQKGLNVQVIWPEEMIFGDHTRLYEIVEWAGLEWNSEIVKHVDKKLWKAREKYGSNK